MSDFNPFMSVSPDREYVIVCNEHQSNFPGTLLFWGCLTADDAESRSFGGYTCQIDRCERYTRAEVDAWRGGRIKEYPFFDDLDTPRAFGRNDEVVITIDQLEELGYRTFKVVGS